MIEPTDEQVERADVIADIESTLRRYETLYGGMRQMGYIIGDIRKVLAAARVAPPAPSEDREKLIDSLRRVAAVLEEYEFEDHASEAAGLMNSAADALAAQAPVDEVKLAEVIARADEGAVTGSKPKRHRLIAHAVREYLEQR